MNELLPARFNETAHHLAVGVEPLDAGRRLRIVQPLSVTFDETPLGLPRPLVDRHPSGLFSLRYLAGVASPVDLRISDDSRRFVPRRFRIPIRTRALADQSPLLERARRPVIFPGAAYEISGTATGVRGRVERNSAPMRWARVEARLSGAPVIVGRAHGDDRGEFLLLIGSEAIPGAVLPATLTVDVQVFGPAGVPVPASPGLSEIDPLWDLPLENAAQPGQADPVLAGETLPAGYTATVSRTLSLALGRLRSEIQAFVIT